MHGHDLDNAREWDERYTTGGEDAMWSGQPNGGLVAEVAALAPGTALDVGCGEGADAIWLAGRGWRVTALDPSRVALDRATAAARRAGVAVEWLHAGLLDLPGDRRYDLVTAQYAVLRHTADDAAITALLAAVAPGGTLLVVHHDLDAHAGHDGHEADHADHDAEHGFDPADYVMPGDVAARLDEDWDIEVDETRPRPGPLPPEARHVRDIVMRARRRSPADESARRPPIGRYER